MQTKRQRFNSAIRSEPIYQQRWIGAHLLTPIPPLYRRSGLLFLCGSDESNATRASGITVPGDSLLLHQLMPSSFPKPKGTTYNLGDATIFAETSLESLLVRVPRHVTSQGSEGTLHVWCEGQVRSNDKPDVEFCGHVDRQRRKLCEMSRVVFLQSQEDRTAIVAFICTTRPAR